MLQILGELRSIAAYVPPRCENQTQAISVKLKLVSGILLFAASDGAGNMLRDNTRVVLLGVVLLGEDYDSFYRLVLCCH